MMFVAALAAVFVTMSLALARAMLGPTVFDRILALNMFGTKTVLFICVVGFLSGRPDFLDLALVYALKNFIGVCRVVRGLKKARLGAIGARPAIFNTVRVSEKLQRARLNKPFWCEVKDVELTSRQGHLNRRGLSDVETGIQERSAHAELAQLIDLVLHQRDQR